jgi:hypothetical protein
LPNPPLHQLDINTNPHVHHGSPARRSDFLFLFIAKQFLLRRSGFFMQNHRAATDADWLTITNEFSELFRLPLHFTCVNDK